MQAILKTSSEDKFHPGIKPHTRISARTQSHTESGGAGYTSFNSAHFARAGAPVPPVSRDAGGWLE